ncbi:MAG: hypothetical protein ACW964_02155 [Candidatus Hodarchaeales archaeon]|jgi:hypothetical protein
MPKSIKNVSSSSFRVTTQELYLKQTFTTECISFEFQKEFVFPDRSYVVDFFLADKILLECSYTRSFKYEIAFRHKAILLEAKTAFIKQFHPYPMCVLLESERPIGTHFYQTLHKLMPSISQILTSRFELLEFLQGSSRKTRNLSNVSPFSSSFFLLDSSKEPSSDNYPANSLYDSSAQDYCPYILSKNNHYRQLIHQKQNSPSTSCNLLSTNYSHIMKKESTNESEVFIL